MAQQILQFIQNHWLLCAAAFVILALLIFEEIKSKISGIPKLSAQDTVLWLNRENAVLVDLRSKTAFSSGHILGAINILRAEIDSNLKKLEPHKSQSIILADDRDTDASSAGVKLQKAGFTKIYVLAGGLGAWKDAQLPLNKK
jgi:rhodanese-related sulfurtransferase